MSSGDLGSLRMSRASTTPLPLSVVVGDVVLALATVTADFPRVVFLAASIPNLDRIAFAEGAAVVLGHGTTLQQDPHRVDVAVLAGGEQRRPAALICPVDLSAFVQQ